MDVTAENFYEALPLVLESINDADFIAFDGEFSGLRRATAEQMISVLDTHQERYCKMSASVREFALLQVGLSCFTYNPDNQEYENATFCFYLLKKRGNVDEPNIFTASSDSLRFLASNNFDFNKLFKSGLPYLTQKEVSHYIQKLPSCFASRICSNTEKPVIGDVLHSFYNDAEKLIKEESEVLLQETERKETPLSSKHDQRETDLFLTETSEQNDSSSATALFKQGTPLNSNSDLDNISGQSVINVHSPQDYLPPRHKVIRFPLKGLKRSSWKPLRVLLVQTFPHVDAEICDDDACLLIRVFATTELRDTFVRYFVIDEFHQTVGFSHVLRHLLGSGKPLVGHTCVMDVLHIIDKFIEPLPDSLTSFKEVYNANFSTVYDTKLLSRLSCLTSILRTTSLGEVFESIRNTKHCPRISGRLNCPSYSLVSDSKGHNAGYDAFMTGVAFVGIVRKLDHTRNRNRSVIHSKLLKEFANKAFLLHLHDIDHLNMSSDDVLPDRRGVLVLSCSQELKYPQIRTMFVSMNSPTIISDSPRRNRHFVIPATEEDKQRGPELLAAALRLAPSHVTISPYSPNKESARTGRYSSLLSPVAAAASTLDARSPEFTPSSMRSALRSHGSPVTPSHVLESGTVSRKKLFQAVSPVCGLNAEQSQSTSPRGYSDVLMRSISDQREDLSKVLENTGHDFSSFRDSHSLLPQKSSTSLPNVLKTSISFNSTEWTNDNSQNRSFTEKRAVPNNKQAWVTVNRRGHWQSEEQTPGPSGKGRGKRSSGESNSASVSGDQQRLKRLKSVGTDQMSMLSLNSPTGDAPLPGTHESTNPEAQFSISSSHTSSSVAQLTNSEAQYSLCGAEGVNLSRVAQPTDRNFRNKFSNNRKPNKRKGGFEQPRW